MSWQEDPLGAIRSAAAETVAGRQHDAGIREIAAEHGADLPAWWRADPSGDGELDVTQFFEITGRCSEILQPRLAEAVVIRVPSETVLRLNPIVDLDKVCATGLSVSLPEPVVFLDFQESPGTGIPLTAHVPIDPPPVMVAAVAAKPEGGPLSLMPIFDNGMNQPRAWGEVLFDDTRELNVPFVGHPGLSVYGRPEIGLFTTPIDMFGSNSLCGAAYSATHLMVQRLLALLAALDDGRAVVGDDGAMRLV
jgi:hypothetical protein